MSQGAAGALDGIRGNPVDQHTLAIHNGAFRGWPGSAVDPLISPDQKWRMVPSRRVNTLKAGISEPSGRTPK